MSQQKVANFIHRIPLQKAFPSSLRKSWSRIIYSEYKTFLETLPQEDAEEDQPTPSELNEQFYRFQLPKFNTQRIRVFSNLGEHEDYPHFEDCLKSCMRVYLSKCLENFLESYVDEAQVFSWANVLHNDSFQEKHNHANATCCGVYYLETPSNTCIRFSNEDETHDIFPSEGDLLLFPPWLEHEVPLVSGLNENEKRVSIGFNLCEENYMVKFGNSKGETPMG